MSESNALALYAFLLLYVACFVKVFNSPIKFFFYSSSTNKASHLSCMWCCFVFLRMYVSYTRTQMQTRQTICEKKNEEMRIQNCMATTMYRSVTECSARYVSMGKNRKTNKTHTDAHTYTTSNSCESQLSNMKHSRHRGRNETAGMAEEKTNHFAVINDKSGLNFFSSDTHNKERLLLLLLFLNGSF